MEPNLNANEKKKNACIHRKTKKRLAHMQKFQVGIEIQANL